MPKKNARLAAVEAQKAAELAAKTKAAADKLRLENELADQLEAERRIIEKKQAEREIAWEHYIGTKYPSLVVAGKTFNDVTVTSVSAVGVTIAYEHGARRFKYDDLSSAIQELCHYDPDVSELAFAEEQKARTHYNQKAQQAAPTKTVNTVNTVTKTQHKSSTLTKPAPKPRGSITARISSQKSGNNGVHYRGSKKYDYHYKTIQVSARSNVPARLYNNGSLIGASAQGQQLGSPLNLTIKGNTY